MAKTASSPAREAIRGTVPKLAEIADTLIYGQIWEEAAFVEARSQPDCLRRADGDGPRRATPRAFGPRAWRQWLHQGRDRRG